MGASTLLSLNLLVLRVLSLLHLRISFRGGKGRGGGGLARRKLVQSQNAYKKEKEENCSLGGGKEGGVKQLIYFC